VGLPAVFHISAANGNRTIVSKGNVPPFNIGPLAFDPATGVYVAHSSSIFRIDPAGNRTLFSFATFGNNNSGPIVGGGLPIVGAKAIAIGAGREILVATAPGVLQLDSKGNRGLLSGALGANKRGGGPRISPNGLAVLAKTVYVLSHLPTDANRYAILSIERNGDRRQILVTDVREPVGMVAAGQRLIIAEKSGRIVSINPKTGEVAGFSDKGKGSGPDLGGISGIAVVPDRGPN
jgi:hypothetical protein